VALGKQLVTQGACAGCHYIEGTPAAQHIGPGAHPLRAAAHLAAGILENDAENLRRWLKNPPEVKPGSKMPNLNLTDQQIKYIAAYLQSLQ
jgi:cytochrome c oxidase subunit 2